MFREWRKSKGFRIATYFTGMLQFAFPPYAIAQSSDPQIVLDGRTNTNLVINQNVTDVYTSTVLGNTGFNSFSIFNVYEGNEVNLFLPDGATALMNMVHNQQTVIDGYLNAYKDGKIGGDVFFLNPHGVVVGKTGVMNVGSAKLISPTQDFMTNMFGANGMISAPQVTRVQDSDIPLSTHGLIAVRGTVNATNNVALSANDVTVTGIVETGQNGVVAIENLVNMNEGGLGGAVIDMSNIEAGISIVADDDVVLAGRLGADGTDNRDAGTIDVRAGDDIAITDGADLSADGQGVNSDGGTVITFADDAAILGRGARLSADGGTSGDGGFVEFSAQRLVELAGGTLSAAAQDGTDGAVLIDPEDIVISADLLRDATTDGGTADADNNTSWNAGALTLQASNSITISDNITVSSRRVSAAGDASAHRTANSIADSGNIILQSDNITLGAGALLTSRSTGTYNAGDITLDGRIVIANDGAEINAGAGGSGEAGNILIDVDDRDNASITLTGTSLTGGNVTLDAYARFDPDGAYDNPTAQANAEISLLSSSTITASDNISLSAVAEQKAPGYSGGVLVQFDARDAISNIVIDGSDLTANDTIILNSRSEINTDLSKEGWANLASLLPADVSVAVTTSKSSITLSDDTALTATTGDVDVTAEAVTLSTVTATAQSVGIAFTGAFSAIDNQAIVQMGDDTAITANDVMLRTRTRTNITTVADSSAAGISGSSGQIAVGVAIINDNTSTSVLDNASITASGAIAILADSELSALTAARATQDDNFTETVTAKFDAGVDDTDALDVDFLGYNLQDALKSNFQDMLDVVPDSFGPESDNNFQLGGAVTYAEITNNTDTTIGVSNASIADAPEITGDDVTVAAQAVSQAQSVASGRTDNASFGGQAGIGIQIFESTLTSQIDGGANANVLVNADNLNVTATTTSYTGEMDNQSRSSVYGISGVGQGGGDNGVGIAGAIAVGINEINDTTARIGDNTTLDLDEDLTLTAQNDTEVKVIADGTDKAGLVSGRLFKSLNSDNSSETDSELDLNDGGGLGVGASIAVATHKNDVEAIFEGGARFTGSDNPDNITIAAIQSSATESEAKGAGAGSISIAPLAAVTAARNTARAIIEQSATGIVTQSGVRVSSTQTLKSAATADGTAQANSDGNAAIGISAAVTVALDSNTAEIQRDVSTNGGDITVSASTYKQINAAAKSSAKIASDDDDSDSDSDESTPDNASNNSTEDASAAGSSVIAGYTSDSDDNATTYDFSSQMSSDTDGATNNASIATVVEPGDSVTSYDFAQSTDADDAIGGDGEDESSSKITVGAAMGVTYTESDATASLADGVTLNAGSGAVTVQSLSNADFSADADASATDGDYNIGGGVGLNIVDNENIAEVGDNVTITSGDLTVRAAMLDKVKEDNTTDSTNVIYADAVAGVGTGEFALAGAVGLNIVLKNNTKAIINSGTDVTASGDVLIVAGAKSKYDANSKATVGEVKGLWSGVTKELRALKDMKMFKQDGAFSLAATKDDIEESVDNATQSDSDGGGDDGEESEGGVGVGAGIALNIIVAEKTQAVLDNDADLLGSNTGAVSVTATAETTTKTSAFAGTKPSEAGGDDAKTSLDAAVSVGILLKDVDAYVGTGSTINATDNITIASSAITKTISTAKGEVTASETAVGASVAVGVALENVDTRLNRSLSTTGGFNLSARADSQDIALADAVAAGAVVDKYASKIGKTTDELTQSTNQIADVNNKPTSLEALNGGFTGGDGASFDTTGSDAATGQTSGGEAQQSGSINIAASVAVNWSEHAARATTADNLSITVGDDFALQAHNDSNYRTRGSGMSVFADQSIGVGVGLLKTGQTTKAEVGDGVTITNSQSSGDVTILASTSENQGTDSDNNSFRSFASAEGIAGAGGGELGVAGALGLVVSTDTQSALVGRGVTITAPGEVTVKSTATNKIVNRAWAIAVASDVTCDDPGNCGGDGGDKTAVGASIAVNVVVDTNKAEIGEDSTITAGDNATILAEDLSSAAGEFTLDPEDNSTTTEDYITTNYTAVLQNSSYYAEAIAGGVAQGGNAGTGSLAVTVSKGSTKAIIGEGVVISADDVTLKAYNESDAKQLVGAVAISTDKKAVGASISGIYLREDVAAIVGDNGDADDNTTTRLVANSGDVTILASAEQETQTYMAAGGVSGNDLALAGAFGFNVMDSDVEARIVEDAVIQATDGDISVNADHDANIRNFALAISGSGGGNSAGGSLAVNVFLADKKAIIGSAASGNDISLNAANNVNVGVNARQEITNGIISAAVSTSNNAISGALSANVIKGDSYALVQQGADINDNSTLNSASTTQSVDVSVSDNTTLFDLTGTLAASSSTSVGVALAGNVMWKDVKAGINSTVIADDNVMLSANTEQNLTATTVGIAASTGGFAGAGSVSFGLIKSTTYADLGSDAVITTDGSVGIHAGDDTDIFMLEPAASFSSGGTALAGAVGAAVFMGTTKARILDNATITAKGQETMQVEIDSTYTSSPLLAGIFGGGDNETRDALAEFNDDFTFENIKDLFLTETRNTETRRGVSVSAVSDQDVISIAASGAVSSDSAIAISLSAGVGINTTEASIGDGARVNSTNTSPHDDQDVTVRAIADTYWVDLSAALGVGTGSAGVGVGADVVVQVKDTDAYIAENAIVKANRDVLVEANARDKVINSAATIGVGSTAGVAGTASVGVIVNETDARIDGDVRAENDVAVDANASSELIQIAGAVGGGGTAGIGASFGVAVVKGTTNAIIGNTAQVDAVATTSVTADSTEKSVAAVLAGGVGGTVGVSVSAGIKVHDSTTKAEILGGVNQRYDNASFTTQDVAVRATNSVTTIDVIGGIGGGGTVGVGVSLNALVVHNKAQASIQGVVSANRDISVEADSAKSTKNFTLAGAAGGTVSVAGNVAVILVGAQADEETDEQMTGSGDNNLADEADSRNNALIVSDIINDNASDGDYSRTGSEFSEVASTIDSKQSETNIGTRFNNEDNTSSLNQTKAFIASSAVVNAGRDLTVEAEDTTETIFTAGAIGGAGVVGVGVTVGVVLVNNTAQAYVGDGAEVNASRNMLIRARTSESVNSGALSAGGAGITSVQGVVMAQKTTSKTHAFIGDNASVNQTDNESSQNVAVLAESDTDLLSVSGSGGGALVGVGITGDAVVLDKETKAYIDDNARVSSEGDITVDADAETDIIQVALSINGGLVGVTGSAGVVVAKNNTSASIGDNAVIFARDSIRLESKDDIEIDGIVVAGSGGAVGVSGAFGVYIVKSENRAEIGDNATITALAQGAGLDAATGTVDNSSTSIVTKSTRDQDNNSKEDNFTQVALSFDTQTANGLSIAAVTNEDMNFAPVGLGFGAVGVAGTVAVTTSSSTTEAYVGAGTVINQDNADGASDQDVRLLAASNTLLNNISSGISAGAAAVSLDSDTQVFAKTVRARMMGDAYAKRDVSVDAKTDDTILQTMVSIAVGGNGQGGIVGVSVVNNAVTAEIGDNTTVEAGDDLTVKTDSDIEMIQTAGNVAGGAGGGIGASLGVLVAKSTNTARIGDGANVTARDDLVVEANSDTSINQNIIGFSGGMGLAITGSVGINVLKTTTIAEIGDDALINQAAGYGDEATQSVRIAANDNVTTQGAAGAAAVGGTAGIGLGLVATVTRNTVQAKIGDDVVLTANDDVTVDANSRKDISNQGIAFAGGVGVGAAGSVALTLIGGGMSDNASDTLTNDNGNMLADAEANASKDRGEYETDNDSANAMTNTRAYTADDDAEANQLAMAQTSGIQSDVEGTDGDSTLAEIGSNVTIIAGGDVTVEATETLELSQISGGAAIGAVGVGGFVAVADYAGSVTSRIGSNTTIDNTTGVTVDAAILSGDGISIDLPGDETASVEGVHSVVVGASVGIVGLAASIAQVNLEENARAEIGDNVTINTASNTADITISSDRDIDADVLVAAVAGGIAAAGISVVDINTSGDSVAILGANSQFGTNDNRTGDVLITARNDSSHTAKAVSAGLGYAGALVGAFVNISDEGETKASIGTNSAIYSNRSVQVTSYENTSNDVDAVGVAVAAGVGLSGVFTEVDVTRDSEVELYDNVTITGDDITIAAQAGDGALEAANNYTIAGAGGALVGANATVSDTDIDVDTSVTIGTNSTITDAGSTSITTNNRTRSQSRTTGLSVGLAAIGANFSYLDDTSDSQIAIGGGVTIETGEHLTVQATSAKNAKTDTVAGAGGAIAATGGEAQTTNTAITRVSFANSTSDNRATLSANDNATIKALNEDEYDHAIDASNVGGVSVSAGLGVSTGSSDLDVTLGDNLDLSATNIFINASNKMAKKGENDSNFAVRGGGAIAVALGTSRANLTQNTDVTIGEFSTITGSGTSTARGITQITAFSGLEIDDEAETNVGGAISVPRSDSRATGVANSTIRFEDNASLTTNWSDAVIETHSAPLVDVRAFTSTYGLVGAGAEARAVANITKTDQVIFETNSGTEIDGTLDVYSGRLATAYYQEHTIDTESRIWNNTAIPIDSGRQSDITFTNNATIAVQSGAALKSTKDTQLMATRLQAAETLGLDRDYLLVKSYGEAKNLYQAAGEAITGGNYSDFYGSETTSGVAGVTIEGSVETGIKKDVSVTINAALSDYYVDDNGTTQRYTIQFDNESENPSNQWVLIDQRIVDQNIIFENDGDNDSRVSPIVGYLNDNITVENASWTMDPEVDFAANVRAEIAALREVLNAYPEGSIEQDETVDNGTDTTTVTTSSSYSTDQLTAMRTDVQSRITVLESSIALYGSEPVPVIKISDIEAATGNVKVVSDYLAGSGTINTPSGESVTITNNSPIALVVNDIEIPDVGGGNIIFNGVTVTTGAQVDTINLNNVPDGQTQGLTLISGENSAAPTVTITNNFDSGNVAYNPDSISDITAPAIALRTESTDGYGGIRNIRGTVNVTNETGSIFSQASIAAGTVEISSGGNYVFDADVNVFHVGGDPRSNTSFSGPTSASTADTVSDYNNGNGVNTIAEMDNRAFTGGCDPLRKEITGVTYADGYSATSVILASLFGNPTSHMYQPTFTEHASDCGAAFSAAQNTDSSSVIAASNDVFISANNLNINGLVQAGITNKSITVSQSEVDNALAANPTANIVTVKSVDKTLEGSIVGNTDNRYVSGDIKLKYDREREELFVTTADVKGGNLTVAGRIISTGNGKLVAADGYGQISITNNSDKALSLSNLSTGGMEGKITIVDSLKDNGLGSSLITEYTRNAGTLTVTNNQGSSSVDNVVSNPQASYSPESGARFNFMSGQQTVDRETEYRTKTTKRLWGVSAFDVGNDFWAGQAVENTDTQSLSGQELPEGDYISVDTGDSTDYTFKADQIETERTLVLDESGTDRCWWGGFLNMVRYCRYYNNTAYVVGSLRYNYHSLRADNDIAIGFSGDEDGGSITVSSNGGVVISGQINNANGTTSITAAGGDILNASETDSISTGNLTLAATAGSIGTAANPIRINQSETDNLTISAGQNVNVASPAGSLYINSINVGGTGAIRLSANQNVELKGSGVLTGHTIDIVAEEGTATAGGGVFRVNTDAENGGTLSIASGGGNINVEETAGDLRINQLITSDNVTITVVNGDLLDGNSEQVDDEIAIADLNALVDQMGLTGTAADSKKDNTIATYQDQVETLYNDYFALRNVSTNSDNETSWDAYDSNFSYTATDAQRSALDDNATRIANFEAAQQTRYQAGYEKFGDPTSYNDNFSYSATEDEIASITNGFKWTDDQLNNKIPVIEFKEVADTTLAIESTNVSGNNITINVDNGSLGRLTHNFTVDLFSEGNADHDIDSLDNTTRLALAAAESEDAQYDNETGIMTISMYEDFDVSASGNVNISADDVVYLGSETNTLIERAEAGGDVRIKMDGNLLNGRDDNNTVVSGQNILLESGKGRIGATDKQFVVDVDNGSTLSGRSRDGIYLTEATGDVNVGSFYSRDAINLISPGAILDNALDTITDIKGLNVSLSAQGAIGEQPSDGDSDTVKKNKALDVATINDDNATFTVASQSDGAWLYTDFDQPMRLTGADINGDLDMAVASALKVVGSLDTNGGSVTLRSFEDLNLEGVGGIDTNGAVLNLSSGDNMLISGTVSTGGGDILATVADNFTMAENTSLSTSGGNLEIDADSLADSLGYQNVTVGDGSVLNLGAGRLLIDASDTVRLTGVITNNATTDAITVNATSIQDGGNSNADITMGGNGDIRFNVHAYANLNKIDYNGSAALDLYIQGKNEGARAVGTMLGIEAEAGVNVQRLIANSAAFDAPLSNVFKITDGTIRDDAYISAGDFDARVGRLMDNMLSPNEWLLSQNDAGYFSDGALLQGQRDEDYRCTGAPSFIGDGNAVLDFTFNYSNPQVNCSGVLAFYRLPYVLQVPVQSVEQELNNVIETMRASNTVAINPVSSVRLEQAILSNDRRVTLAAPGVAPEQVIAQDAIDMGLSDGTLASDFANSFGVRDSSALGVVQVDTDTIIQLGLPVFEQAPISNDILEEEEAEDGEEPVEEANTEDDVTPLAATSVGVNDDAPIGPLSLVLN